MSPKQKIAIALRKFADKIDPPVVSKESSVILQPVSIQALDGFGQTESVAPEGDWTWTQGSNTRYL